MLSLLESFRFTTITILVVQLLDASQIVAQLTLFFLALFFHVFIFVLFWRVIIKTRYLKMPLLTGQRNIFNLLLLISIGSWLLSIALMFLLWNLTLLALASVLMTFLGLTLFYITVWTPMIEHRKTAFSTKKQYEQKDPV